MFSSITTLSSVLLLSLLSGAVVSQSIIKTLPGFAGDLPFKLETGYIGVGELDEVQLFYYFIESERSPKDDPLMLWLTGGPGCSGLSGLLYEIGPLSFNYANSSGNKPTLLLNPYSWTKVANIIFLDAPAGTGFSYAESWDGYNSNDTSTAAQNYEFLRKSTKKNCKGEYTYPDPSNAACIENLQVVSECIAAIRLVHILEPRCSELSQKPNKLWDWSYLSDSESIIDILASTPQVLRPWCRSYNYPFSNIWANDNTVQNALHVQEGTITTWDRCNESLAYKYNFKTSLDYQQNLTKKHLRGLVYSGDHDMVIPYVGTLEWIETLNLTIEDSWRPWFVDGQVAGYVTIYAENQYSLTFTTIKGGGHTAPEYKPKETLAMIERWFAYYYL